MNQDRKKIILNEILYWRKNKLLPEAYCNFLISLYTEGEGVEPTVSSGASTRKTFMSLFVVGSLLPILFLVTYFTEISPILQMVINFIFLIVCIFVLILTKKTPLILHMGSIIIALFILILSVNGSEILFNGESVYLLSVITLNCMGWLVVGVFSTKKYFLVAGIIGSLTSAIILFGNF